MPPIRRSNLGRRTRNATNQANYRSNHAAQERNGRNERERIRISQTREARARHSTNNRASLNRAAFRKVNIKERNRDYQRAWRQRQKEFKKKISKVEKEKKRKRNEIDTSNVEPQIKEEREDPEDNLDIEMKIPSLKLNMEMDHEVDIKEEITIEENNFQCRICLSVGRRMSLLEEYETIYKKLLFDNYQDQKENWFSTVQVCWECHAVLRSVDRFQRKVRTAHDMLQSQQNDVSLSTLTTVVFSDSNPETIYLIEADKQTDQLNSETDTDNPEDNELLIERNIVKRETKFKGSEDVEIFRRVDLDLNDLKKVLDERKNEESYKQSRFRCSTCILSFDDENELNGHNRECHDEEENLERHGRTHGSTTECLECGQLFRNHCQFNDHYKKSHEMYTCDHCGLTFKIKLCLVKHISKKHMKLESKICGKTFSRYNSLWLPNKKFHSPLSESAYLEYSVKHKPKNSVRFPCSECLKGFATKSKLKKHYETFHLKLIKFKCVDCDKYFERNADLTRHRRKFHGNVLPHKN